MVLSIIKGQAMQALRLKRNRKLITDVKRSYGLKKKVRRKTKKRRRKKKK